MFCNACRQQTHHIILIQGTWYCRDCAPHVPSRIQANAKHYWDDGKGAISAAHLDDIKHRVYNPDGSVTRDTGRKTIRF